jgi:nicotinamide-nucleotide amidase
MPDHNTHTLSEALAETMLAKRYLLVTAESCTGGGIAHALTSLAGSSLFFERGFVTYSNESKQDVLQVSLDTLNRYGAVSEECAAEMAAGALINSRADIAVSVTGIAGPDGGSEDKPVGTVCFGWARREQTPQTARTIFPGDREAVREQSIQMALQGLLDMLGV